jgi:dimethyladenosine transferase 1
LRTLTLPRLPSISEIIRMYGLTAYQQLSQNFILDMNLCAKIVRVGGPVAGSTVVEVGAGPGNLTRAALLAGARHVVAIEKDKRFLPALEMLREAAGPERMTIVLGDALEVDETKLLRDAGAEHVAWELETPAKVHLVGNLPFSVSIMLMLKWLRQIPRREGPFEYGRAPLTLMFQKEVAKRMTAKVGSRDYTRLSVMTQYCAHAQLSFFIPGEAFVPMPEVDTGVVTVRPRKSPVAPANQATLEHVLHQVFQQRRKVISNAVQTLKMGDEVFAASKLEGLKRPEQLTIEEWCTLSNAYDRVHAEAFANSAAAQM